MYQSSTTAFFTSKLACVGDHVPAFLLSVLAVFAPLKVIMCALMFLVATDLFTGLLATHLTKAKFTSRKLARTVVKTFVYLTTIIVVHVANKYLLSAGDFVLPLDSLIVSFISLTELKSILENLQKIQKQPFLQFIIDKIASDSSKIEAKLEPEPAPEKRVLAKAEGAPKKSKSPAKENKGGTTKRQR